MWWIHAARERAQHVFAEEAHDLLASLTNAREEAFARSGLAVRWSGRHSSVLDLADACDVLARWSCRTGVCHICVTPLLSGDVTYDPDPLEPPASTEALICRARPATDVVLDLWRRKHQ